MVKLSLSKNPLEKKARRIKEKALELYSRGQIPSYLAYFIDKCDLLSHDEVFVHGLMEITNHSMRVAGYYKKYPQIDKEMSKTCKESLHKMIMEERG